MSQMRLGGRFESALSHMMLFGLADIMQEAKAEHVGIWWEDGPEPAPMVSWEGTDPVTAVIRHLKRHADPDSWVQQLHNHDGREVGLFSPRIAAAKDATGWKSLVDARRAFLDSGLSNLDLRMIGALGEPAYWVMDQRDGQPDSGATRWEMIVRTGGSEFIGQRLAPLATALVERSQDDIQQSLRGEHLHDVNRKRESRTPTGFTVPQQVDAVLAWCALWGMTVSVPVPQSPKNGRAHSQTPGTWPRNKVHPETHILPVWASPVSVGKVRSVIRSVELDAFARSEDEESARLVLAQAGVIAIVRFPVRVGGTSNAPERVLLDGSVELIYG